MKYALFPTRPPTLPCQDVRTILEEKKITSQKCNLINPIFAVTLNASTLIKLSGQLTGKESPLKPPVSLAAKRALV